MTFSPGVDCFFFSNLLDPKRGYPDLFALNYNAESFEDRGKLDLKNIRPGRGVSSIRFGDSVRIHLTTSDGSVQIIQYDGRTPDIKSQIPNVRTTDPAASVLFENEIWVYYRESGTALLKVVVERMGRWSDPTTVVSPSGQSAIKVNWGPAAASSRSDVVLAYNEYGTDTLKVISHRKSGQTIDLSPKGSTLNFSPALSRVGDDLYVLHHGHRDNNRLYSLICKNSLWSKDDPIKGAPSGRDSQLKESPTSCVLGDRVFAFYHGTDACLYMQVYMGGRWLERDIQVKVAGKPLTNLWWGPSTLAT